VRRWEDEKLRSGEAGKLGGWEVKKIRNEEIGGANRFYIA
jgi:hypothetical protein